MNDNEGEIGVLISVSSETIDHLLNQEEVTYKRDRGEVTLRTATQTQLLVPLEEEHNHFVACLTAYEWDRVSSGGHLSLTDTGGLEVDGYEIEFILIKKAPETEEETISVVRHSPQESA